MVVRTWIHTAPRDRRGLEERQTTGDSLAHLLEELVVLETLIRRHIALGLALLLDDLLDMLLVLVRGGRRVFLCLVLLRLSLLVALVCAMLLRLHGLLRCGWVLVGSVLRLFSRVVSLSMTDKI